MGSLVLLDLMGGVALLLWGLHMVHSGILRAFGPDLRLLLAKAPEQPLHRLCRRPRSDRAAPEQHRDRADHEFVHVGRAGQPGARARHHARRQCRHHADRADPVVQHLRRRARCCSSSAWSPSAADRARASRTSAASSIGLGLMLLALHILLDTLAPAENAPGVRVFMNAITGDPVLCILLRRGRDLGWCIPASPACCW